MTTDFIVLRREQERLARTIAVGWWVRVSLLAAILGSVLGLLVRGLS